MDLPSLDLRLLAVNKTHRLEQINNSGRPLHSTKAELGIINIQCASMYQYLYTVLGYGLQKIFAHYYIYSALYSTVYYCQPLDVSENLPITKYINNRKTWAATLGPHYSFMYT